MLPKNPSDSQLWSWIDRRAPELEQYRAQGSGARARIAALEGTLSGIRDSAPPLPQRIAGFRIEGVLGRGGMGVVYAATQDAPKRQIALKVLPPGMGADPLWLERFRREADALARLNHPGICAVHASGIEDGAAFLAMQRIHGVPLQDWLAEKPNPRRRLRLAQALCTAVGHAHDHGVVHRDLKPGNVLVTEDDQPVVVDFGLASLGERSGDGTAPLTQAGSLLGTLPYMSPEQVSGAPDIDARADVYSLGVLLFEMFSGTAPYRLDGLSLPDAARRICETPAQLRGTARRRLSGDLRLVVLQALNKRPAERYADAGELAADLQRCLDGRMVQARRASVLQHGLRLLRRRWLAATSVALLLSLALLLMFPAWLPSRLGPDWWWTGSPFAGLRWVGDSPQVQVQGTWYELETIEGLHADYIVGFCKQTAAPRSIWRKRFSEDLVQVLNRLGVVCILGLDLELRDLQTGAVVQMDGVPCTSESRQRIWEDRNAWPWELRFGSRPGEIWIEGRRYELLKIDDLAIPGRSSPNGLAELEYYDAYCRLKGRSPGPRVDLELRDLETGERRRLEGLPRRRPGMAQAGEQR